MIVRPRSAEHYALENAGFEPVAQLGSGKTASAILGRIGMLQRVFRIVKGPPFDVDLEEYFTTLRRRYMRSHALAKAALRTRVPRAVDTYIVRNKRGGAIAIATMMEYVRGLSLQDQMKKKSLTAAQLHDLAKLFRLLWSNRLSHGDAIPANILYDSTRKHYVFIDVDHVKQHASSAAAKRADLPMMQAGLGKVADVIENAVQF